MSKKQFIAKLLHERDKFELLLNQVGFTRGMTIKGAAGKWSVKETLAHILAYEQYLADRMNEILHDEPYTPSKTQTALDAFLDEFGYPDFGSPLLDDDTPNAWIIEKYRSVSLEEVVAQEIQAFSAVLTALENMPEELLDRHHLYSRVLKHTCEHYREHAHEIRNWLKANTARI
jgi:hypothetical protein